MRITEIVIISFILTSFIIGVYSYPKLPDKLASHWDASGQVNGYLSKFWGLFLMPLMSIVLFLFFIAIPEIDPLKNNIKKFRAYYDGFILTIIVFLFYMYLLTIFWNYGFNFNMIQFMLPALGILFYYVGVLLENSKMNWFIGVRTPWTMSNEKVWDATNKEGGKWFKAAGIISFIGLLFPKWEIFFILVPVFIAAIYTAVFSYFEYKKYTRK